MSEKNDLYKVLGISEKASHDEIKKAYRSLSLKYHPDRNPSPDATEKFKLINEAYETLGDEQKRRQYDAESCNPFLRMNNMHHMHHMHDPNMSEMDDLFKVFFGGMPFMGGLNEMNGAQFHVFHNGRPVNIGSQFQKPSPITKTITIDIEQVYNGSTIPVDIERWINDHGTKIFEKETMYVSIPKGIDENEIIVLKDKGNVDNEHCKGDVKLFVKIINNTEIKRNGLDLIYDKKITLKEALCGFTFEIRFINGKIYTLNNNSGNIITPEYKKIVPNMGLTREGHTGNLIVLFHVEFPEKLTNEQIQKLSELL
jgi:DnaJ family protein B protein 4